MSNKCLDLITLQWPSLIKVRASSAQLGMELVKCSNVSVTIRLIRDALKMAEFGNLSQLELTHLPSSFFGRHKFGTVSIKSDQPMHYLFGTFYKNFLKIGYSKIYHTEPQFSSPDCKKQVILTIWPKIWD